MKIREPDVIYKNGKPAAVILPLAEYNELLERVEDAADITYLTKLRRAQMNFRLFKEYVKERTPKKAKPRA